MVSVTTPYFIFPQSRRRLPSCRQKKNPATAIADPRSAHFCRGLKKLMFGKIMAQSQT
jgi:hypothetical protein